MGDTLPLNVTVFS